MIWNYHTIVEKKYTIKYNLDGGINDDGNISAYAAISLAFELKEPTKEG